MKVTRNFMDEVKILTSGSYYMTPFNKYHILEMLPRLHTETEKEPIPSEAVSNAFRKLGIKQ